MRNLKNYSLVPRKNLIDENNGEVQWISVNASPGNADMEGSKLEVVVIDEKKEKNSCYFCGP